MRVLVNIFTVVSYMAGFMSGLIVWICYDQSLLRDWAKLYPFQAAVGSILIIFSFIVFMANVAYNLESKAINES